MASLKSCLLLLALGSKKIAHSPLRWIVIGDYIIRVEVTSWKGEGKRSREFVWNKREHKKEGRGLIRGNEIRRCADRSFEESARDFAAG